MSRRGDLRAGGEAIACVGSVTERRIRRPFVGTALDAFGGLDIIVNNAGYTWDNVIQKMTDEQFQAMLDVHLRAPFRILRAARRADPDHGQAEAEAGPRCSARWSTSRRCGALRQRRAGELLVGQGGHDRTDESTLCKEWGRYKVNVNCVAFGLIKTRLTQPIEGRQKTIDVDGRDIKVGVNAAMIDAMAEDDSAGARRHAGGSGGCGLPVLQPGIELHQRTSRRLWWRPLI